MARLGTGIGWRPEIARHVEELPGLDWVEVVAENICPGHLPDALLRLRERGTTIVPHGVSLGLGGPEPPDPARLAALAERAGALGAPLVTEHIAFVRAGGPLTASPRLEAGHLLPVPRTRDALDVLCENVRIAQDALPVPLALENIAALISWPGEELTEGRFLAELVERTGVGLLIDVANLHTNAVNRGEDPSAVLDALPCHALAYVHVAGGVERDGVWHDSHAHPVTGAVLDVLAELCARADPPGVLLERDDDFPGRDVLAAELDAIRAVVTAARAARTARTDPAGRGVLSPPVAGPGRGAGTEQCGGPDGDADRGAPAVPAETVAETAPGQPAATATGTTGTSTTGTSATAASPDRSSAPPATEAARLRLAVAQTALLSSLVAGTPAPDGFDRGRLRVQSRALVRKRTGVIAKVAPELPEILGPRFRAEFEGYARNRPMTGGHRQDALNFAAHVLSPAGPRLEPAVRRRLGRWWRERSRPAPPLRRRVAVLLRGGVRRLSGLTGARRAQASPATSSETAFRRPV